MKDQNPRQRYLDSSKFTLADFIGGILCLISVAIMLVLFFDRTPATNTAYDHAVSPELHSYLQGPGKGVYLNEGGLE